MGLAAIGAGIAVLTGLGAGIGKLEISIRHYYLVVH